MKRAQPDYLSYLLRVWRANGASIPGSARAVWRASLENPHTRAWQGFASLDDLFDFLQAQIGDLSGDSEAEKRQVSPQPADQTTP